MTPYYADDYVTLFHGDARECLPAVSGAALVLTDPPYGIGLVNHGQERRRRRAVAGDESQALGQWALDLCAERMWPTIAFANPMRPWAGEWRQFLVWDKGPAVGGGGDPSKCWKASWELVQVRDTGDLHGARDSAVLRFWANAADPAYADHPTPKPLPLLAYLIGKVALRRVLDPFAGSGSTLVAAKSLGCRAIGIEIEERYCEVAAKRLSQEVLGLVA